MKTPATSSTPSPCKGRTIILGVSGSIAAYKACELLREFIKRGADVHAMLTRHACEFVTAMTFQTLSRNPVTVGLFDQIAEWQPEHIALSERADVLCVAPATANVIAKLAHGLADDALTTTAVAFAGPLVIAPAMNTRMYEHPATVGNMDVLRRRGATIVPAESGELACGTVGPGRLPPIEQIVAAVEAVLPGGQGTAR